MPGALTLETARARLTVLTTKPVAVTDIPIVSEATAGIYASNKINKGDFRLSPTASDSVADALLDADSNASAYGNSNYEAAMTVMRFLDATGKPDATDDALFTAVKTKGTHLWLMLRVGPPATQVWAAADLYDLFHVITDHPQQPQDRAGFIKNPVPMAVQKAWLGLSLSAT